MRSCTLIPSSTLEVIPWKNGGGTTRELFVAPVDAGLDSFVWRASIAEVTREGPFSLFPGIDRILTLVNGESLLLMTRDGTGHILASLFEPVAFAGEVSLVAHLPSGPARALNLMIRSGTTRASVAAYRGGQQLRLEAGAALLYSADGATLVEFGDLSRYRIGSGDALLIEMDEQDGCALIPESGDSVVIAAMIV